MPKVSQHGTSKTYKFVPIQDFTSKSDIDWTKSIEEIDQQLYKKYAGKYLSETFGLLHVTHEGNKLFLRPDPIPGKEQLIPSSETTFYFGNQSLELQFFLDEKENVIGQNIKGQNEGVAKKQN